MLRSEYFKNDFDLVPSWKFQLYAEFVKKVRKNSTNTGNEKEAF